MKKVALILLIVLSSFVLTFASLFSLSAVGYSAVFARRSEPAASDMLFVGDFEGLNAQKHSFMSSDGETLVGYMYTENTAPSALVVFVHGFGAGGQNLYMSVTAALAHEGFAVFAYDGSGTGESGGKQHGMPQSVSDLNDALDYLETLDEYSFLPVILMGHSQGAYAVACNLALRPSVQGAVIAAGFNRSIDAVEYAGERMTGGIVPVPKFNMSLYERMLFGKFSRLTALDGFAASDAKVMIIAAESDIVIPGTIGYDIFYETYSENERFTFISYPERSHSNLLLSDGARNAAENADPTERYEADGELISQIARFIADCTEQ